MAIYEQKHVTLRDGATLLLRSPVEADAARMLAYLDAVRRETDGIIFGPADVLPTLDEERGFIRRHRDGPQSVHVTAWDGEDMVALVGVDTGREQVRVRHRAELGISVRKAWCDRGLGTLLMREAIAWCRSHPELEVLRLGVFARNERALAVYRKVGFDVEGCRRWSVRFEDGTYGDELMMSLWVGSASPGVAEKGCG